MLVNIYIYIYIYIYTEREREREQLKYFTNYIVKKLLETHGQMDKYEEDNTLILHHMAVSSYILESPLFNI